MNVKSIIWRRFNQPGHELCRLFFKNSHWNLTGTTIFLNKNEPCLLNYFVICNSDWKTRSGRVNGWIGDDTIKKEFSVDSSQIWRINGIKNEEVQGCIDLDLAFSPATNLLPIRRLDLEIGQEATVRAAWLHFPSFTFEPLEQLYRRIDEVTYHYEILDGSFEAELKVDAAGFISIYPNLWQDERII